MSRGALRQMKITAMRTKLGPAPPTCIAADKPVCKSEGDVGEDGDMRPIAWLQGWRVMTQTSARRMSPASGSNLISAKSAAFGAADRRDSADANALNGRRPAIVREDNPIVGLNLRGLYILKGEIVDDHLPASVALHDGKELGNSDGLDGAVRLFDEADELAADDEAGVGDEADVGDAFAGAVDAAGEAPAVEHG